MALRRTKLLSVQSVTGITTVGIFTAGVTNTGAGVAGTTYVRGLIAHNTGLATCTSALYVYPSGVDAITGYGHTAYRLSKVDLAANETFFFETNYPLVLTDQDKIVVEVGEPALGGTGIGSVVNYQILGDTDN